jgi:uncharacterized DUF497 family protein
VRWTWDDQKAAENAKKHNVSFELAERALGDPFSLTIRNDYPLEERWTTLCSPSSEAAIVLYVVHTWPDDEDRGGRIISARLATNWERRVYEEGES